MPRFMGFVRMEEGIGTPPQALFEAMDAYIGEQAAKGVFLDGGGLFGTEDAVNFVVRKGEVTRVDGPYAEAKEVVGGWALMQYDSLEEAIADQQEFAELHAKHWPECTMVATLRQISDGPRGSRPTDQASLRWPRAGADSSQGDPSRGHHRRLAGRVRPPRRRPHPDDPRRRARRGPRAGRARGRARAVAHAGVPDNPGAWLMTTAKRRAVDHFRRADTLRRKTARARHTPDREEASRCPTSTPRSTTSRTTSSG